MLKIGDKKIQEHLLAHKNNSTLNIQYSKLSASFTVTLDKEQAYKNADFVIIANRMIEELTDVKTKVYIRDLFNSD